MKRSAILSLALVTVVAVIAAAVSLSRYERRTSVAFEPQPMYPDLIARAQEVTQVSLADSDRSVRLWRDADGWHVAQRHDYPADEQKIANLLTQLSRVQLLEPRSDKPQLQERMNLRDLSEEGSRAKQVRLLTGEAPLADLLIGETRRAAGSGPRQFYTRRVGEAHAWLAQGDLDPAVSPTAWLATTVVDVEQARIRRITIEHPDGDRSVLERQAADGDFTLADAPEGEALNQTRLNAASYGIQGLPLNDVLLPDEIDISFAEPVRVTFDTFDGLRVVVEVASRQRSSYYARLHARPVPLDTAAADQDQDQNQNQNQNQNQDQDQDPAAAARINDLVSGWIYLIPPHTADTFTRRRDEFFETDDTAESPAET